MVHENGIPEIKITPPDEEIDISTNIGNGTPGPRHGHDEELPGDQTKTRGIEEDDPTWKFLAVMLGAMGINDNWQNYVLFIGYPGSKGSKELTGTIPNYAEQPMRIPAMWNHVKKCSEDIVDHVDTAVSKPEGTTLCLRQVDTLRSPIELARKKVARTIAHYSSSREASSDSTGGDNAVNKFRSLPKMSSSRKGELIVSPSRSSNEEKERKDCSGPRISLEVRMNALDASADFFVTGSGGTSVNTSYAIAILPSVSKSRTRRATGSRSLTNIVIDDMFIILSRKEDRWLVLRDRTGNGVVDNEAGERLTIPPTHLLEISVPISLAVKTAKEARSLAANTPNRPTYITEIPILPLNVLSPKLFDGVALLNYRKRGEGECNLAKDTLVHPFKEQTHWLYVVNEHGDKGWVPSWIIGRIDGAGVIPSIPSPAIADETPTFLKPPQNRFERERW